MSDNDDVYCVPIYGAVTHADDKKSYNFRLRLLSVSSENRIPVAVILRKVLKITPEQAFKLIDDLGVLGEDLSEEESERFAAMLKIAGAEVEIEKDI